MQIAAKRVFVTVSHQQKSPWNNNKKNRSSHSPPPPANTIPKRMTIWRGEAAVHCTLSWTVSHKFLNSNANDSCANRLTSCHKFWLARALFAACCWLEKWICVSFFFYNFYLFIFLSVLFLCDFVSPNGKCLYDAGEYLWVSLPNISWLSARSIA